MRVHVEDAAGARVRELGSFHGDRRTARVTWDGTNDAATVVADGAYRFVLVPDAEGSDPAERLEVGVTVDTVVPGLSVRRPTIGQLNGLARRATELRDARVHWKQKSKHGRNHGRWSRGNGNGNRGNGLGHGNRRGWSEREERWVELFEARQLRLPITFSTYEDATVGIESIIDGRSSVTETWRSAGRHTVEVVLPTYVGGERARITVAAIDDAGNVRRHTLVVSLPRLPEPKRTRRQLERPSQEASATGVPSDASGPLPDWLDPIMLRATYEAGVPQSWARSQSLANIIRRESSFRPTAQNPTSTAYGLFQFLDQTWATVRCTKSSDAYRQSVCGLRYIQRRYRTPERAWAFWQANHWY